MTRFYLSINGDAKSVDATPETPLLYVLRNDLGMRNPRFGCGLGQCGACTVHLDGSPVRSCVLPVESVGDSKVVTLAGLGGPGREHHPVQKAFIEEEALQCGFCLNGWLMTAVSLLDKNPKPSDAEIREAMGDLKCRCSAHLSMIRAIKRAADLG